MFIKQYKTAYPAAKVIGPEDFQSEPELEGIKIDIVFGTADPNPMCGFEGDREIETCYFTGYANKDISCYHKASKTVMAAHLLFNNPPIEQFSKSTQSPKSMLFSSMTPTGWQMRLLLRSKTQDRVAMRRDAANVLAWDFDRFIPCHGISDVFYANHACATDQATWQSLGRHRDWGKGRMEVRVHQLPLNILTASRVDWHNMHMPLRRPLRTHRPAHRQSGRAVMRPSL
ncbi:hypothetical protein OH76DRAFT_1407241 [Lentinus brumalis]|uniref:Uncharacterized protein n=1 Tax=Lentinus brumalis TaxID=2498619 RepID=A0A371D0R6_9APHY|nr:hypothetical protein OH76DRAFT_1407241 [Polyporus brumalis]